MLLGKRSNKCVMDSDANKTGRTDEEPLSVLGYIREKLRPVLLRKWRGSRANVVAEAMADGLSDDELELYLRGFKKGYWNGAVDTASISPRDLRPGRPKKTGKIH